MLVAILLLLIVSMSFFGLLGQACIPNALRKMEDKFFLTLLAPIIGTAVWSSVTLFLGTLRLYNSPFIWFEFVVAIIFICVRWRRIEVCKDKRIGLVLLFSIILIPCLLYPLLPKMMDGGIYFGNAIADHVKVAMVSMISKSGLPPQSPFFSENGVPVPIVYYYGWHAIAAQFSILTNASAYVADLTLVGITGLQVFFIVAAFSYKFTLSKLSICISFISILFSTTIITWLPTSIDQLLQSDNPLLGFFHILSCFHWTPQHMHASCFILVIIWFCTILLSKRHMMNYASAFLLIALICSACFMSIHAGFFALFLLAASLLVLSVIRKSVRVKFTRHPIFWMSIFVLSVGICAKFMLYLIQNTSETSPLTLGVLPIYEESGLYAAIKTFFYFYCAYLPWRFGIYYFILLFFLFKRNLLSKRYTLLESLMRLFSFLSLLIIFFVHSNYYSNDFGWRIITALCVFMTIALTIALTRSYYGFISLKNCRLRLLNFAVFLLIIGFMVLTIPDVYSTLAYKRSDTPLHNVTFARAIPGWTAVRDLTQDDELVLSNPKSFDSIIDFTGGYNVNIFHALYSNRPTPVSDYIMAKSYSLQIPDSELKSRYLRVVDFFAGNPTEADVIYVANELCVKAILITPLDGIWQKPGVLETYYKIKVDSPDYRVYIRR